MIFCIKNKSIIKKIIIFSMIMVFVANVMATAFSIDAMAAEQPTAQSISLNMSKTIDVALSIGITDEDYSEFEKDLKLAMEAYAIEKGKIKIPEKDINIMDIETVAVNSSNEFDWWNYDHSIAANINPSTNTYVEKIADYETANANNSKLAHIEESNNGSTVTFYGYGASGFVDFKYLPNAEAAQKEFTFDIVEDVAHDALDGVGFLLNSEIKGTYGVDQVINGYLLFNQYNENGVGEKMRLYKLTNVDTKVLHTTSNLYHRKFSSMTGCTLIAETSYNDVKYRKFKVIANPTSLQVFYGEFGKDDVSIYNNTTYDDLDAINWTIISDNSKTNSVSLDIISETAGGFGPLSSYASHSCERLTILSLVNLTMSYKKVRLLKDVIREPDWGEDTLKFLVNLNEDPIDDFADKVITSELLSRLQNEEIDYIAWCSDNNVAASEEFLNKNFSNGAIVNVDTLNYQEQIKKIAKSICDRYWAIQETVNTDVVLVTDNVSVTVTDERFKNTIDSEYPSGKWKVVHSLDGFKNATQLHELSGIYTNDINLTFNKPGKYDIYYGEKLIKTVIAHYAPVANFTSSFDDDGNVSYVNESYDPDNRGDLTYEWYYLDLDDADITSQQLQKVSDNNIYMLVLKVTDIDGASTTTSRLISNAVGIPPFAYFSLKPSTIYKTNGINDYYVNISDISYDLAGLEVTSDFKLVYGKSTKSVTLDSLDRIELVDPSEGMYTLKLVVTNSQGEESELVSRKFQVLSDNIKPVIVSDTASFDIAKKTTKVTVSVTDEGGSGYQKLRYAVTSSNTAPLDEDIAWSEWTTASFKTIELNQDGTNYIHCEAYDNALNLQSISFGPYEIDNTPPVITGIVDGKTYYTTQKITALDDNLSSVKVNNVVIANGGKITGNCNATYVVVATDDAGNVSTCTVKMRPIESLMDEIKDLKCSEVDSKALVLINDIKDIVKSLDITYATQDELNKIKEVLNRLEALNWCGDHIDIIAEIMVTESDRERIDNALNTYDELDKAVKDYIDSLVLDDLKKKEKACENFEDLIEAKETGIKIIHEDLIDDIIEYLEGIMGNKALTGDKRADADLRLENAKEIKHNIEVAKAYLEKHKSFLSKNKRTIVKDEYKAVIEGYLEWRDKLTDAQKSIIDDIRENLRQMYIVATSPERQNTSTSNDLKNVNNATAYGLENVFEDLSNYTEEDDIIVKDGGYIDIDCVVSVVEGKLAEGEIEVLNNSSIHIDTNKSTILDITVWLTLRDEFRNILKKVALTDLEEEIEIVISLTQEQQKYSYIQIFRIHNGVVEYLKDIDNDPSTYTFKSSKFSTYILSYGDEEQIIEAPKTGDAQNIFGVILIMCVFGLAFIYLGKTKSREE